MNHPIQFLSSAITTLGGTSFPLVAVPVGNIIRKPVPRWPDRRSYRSHARDAAKRRNVAKGGSR